MRIEKPRRRRLHPAFVAVTVAPPEPTAATIRIEVQRGNVLAKVEWPLQEAVECSIWLVTGFIEWTILRNRQDID